MDTIFIDIDGTFADSVPWWITLFNHDHLTSYTKYDLTEYDPRRCMGIDLSPYYVDYRGVSVVKGALSATARLQEFYTIAFVTAGFGSDWLRAQGYRGEIIQCKNRSFLRGFALIDDYDKNLDAFEGEKFLIEQPWTMNSKYSTYTWERITEVLLERLNTSDGVFAPTG